MPSSEMPTPYTDLALCRESLCSGSRSFWFASRILPTSLRNTACGLYAFCREADDAIDDGRDPDAELRKLHRRLDNIYGDGNDMSSTDRVLARIVKETDLPRPLLDALLEGFAWDARGERYATLSELYSYCARVAGSVGVMMCVLMGVRDRAALARASDLGVAMQLSNIARDVGEDARAGRLYLPLDSLHSNGLDPDEFISDPRLSDSLAGVISELLDHADTFYARSEHGVSSLPLSCRPGIYAARTLYAAIGHRVRDLGCDSINQRAYLSGAEKLALLSRTPKCLGLGSGDLHLEPLPECAFLVNAVLDTPVSLDVGRATRTGIAAFPHRMMWMLEAVATLEQRSAERETGANLK